MICFVELEGIHLILLFYYADHFLKLLNYEDLIILQLLTAFIMTISFFSEWHSAHVNANVNAMLWQVDPVEVTEEEQPIDVLTIRNIKTGGTCSRFEKANVCFHWFHFFVAVIYHCFRLRLQTEIFILYRSNYLQYIFFHPLCLKEFIDWHPQHHIIYFITFNWQIWKCVQSADRVKSCLCRRFTE